MPENEPLLRAEEGADDWAGPKPRRERAAHYLESSAFHKLVIALITVDAVCVLADLFYTFLSEECNPAATNPAWLETLSIISLTITTFLLLEIPITLWAIGFNYYNPFGDTPHATLHLFDALVISTTFILEFVLKGKERELAGLLIVLRLWRIIKLVGGIAAGAGEIEEETAKELAQAKRDLMAAQEEIQQLRQRLSSTE